MDGIEGQCANHKLENIHCKTMQYNQTEQLPEELLKRSRHQANTYSRKRAKSLNDFDVAISEQKAINYGYQQEMREREKVQLAM